MRSRAMRSHAGRPPPDRPLPGRPLPSPPLLLITDRAQARLPLPALLDAAFAGGLRWASLREKDLDPAARRDLLAALLPVARRHGAVLTVHADLDAARLCDGLHLPEGGDVATARAALGPAALVGVSCHDRAGVARAAAAGADYVTLGPVRLTASKPGYGPALGFGPLRDAASLGVPVLALGGVDAGCAGDCRAAGAAGLAVMGGPMRAADPAAEARALVSAWAAAAS